MKRLLGEAGNKMVKNLGVGANITVGVPLKEQLETVEFLTIFMNSILGLIVCFLAFLSIQLIYSLMLSDIEEKTYEIGMLRALGFNTDNVVHLIMSQAIFFAIPGLFFGLVAANVLNSSLRQILFTLTSNYGTYELPWGGYLIGISIGLIMPIISNILPI